MPFKSQSQWDKFGELLSQGKITQATFDEWAHSSPAYHTLPAHVGDTKRVKAGGLAAMMAKRAKPKKAA